MNTGDTAMSSAPMKAHANDYFGERFEPHEWRADGTCSYCGSMSPADATKALMTPGTHYSGSDWKYGWPHKFYIESNGKHGKFYSVHLLDSSPEEFAAFNTAAANTIGVRFSVHPENGRLGYVAPLVGFQTWGNVP